MVVVERRNQGTDTGAVSDFENSVASFLAKLIELCGHSTTSPVDAFQVGRELSLPESETENIVTHALQKRWIRESDQRFDRINTGDPPPTRRFRFVFVTSEGLDKHYKVQDLPTEPLWENYLNIIEETSGNLENVTILLAIDDAGL